VLADCETDRLAHAQVIERLARQVEMQRVDAAGPGAVEDGVGFALFDRLQPAGRAGALDDVHLPRQEGQGAGRAVQDIADLQLRRRRRAGEMILECRQRYALDVVDVLDPERSGTDRVERELVGAFVERLATEDIAAHGENHAAAEQRVGTLQAEFDGVCVGRSHAGDILVEHLAGDDGFRIDSRPKVKATSSAFSAP
jgi:hypothetical protein